MAATQPRFLLAKLMFLPAAYDVNYPWQHPRLAEFDERHRALLHHARLLSELMYGAALLYNLLLAEVTRDDGLVAEHRAAGGDWRAAVDAVGTDLARWSLDWVPRLAIDREQVVSPSTLEFCRRWLELVRSTGGDLLDHAQARALVRSRELRLSPGLRVP